MQPISYARHQFPAEIIRHATWLYLRLGLMGLPTGDQALVFRHPRPVRCRGSFQGSVRARASKDRLSWDEANPGSCGLQDGQHGHTPPEVEQSASVGGNMLVMAGAEAEKVAEFIVSATEPSGGSGAF